MRILSIKVNQSYNWLCKPRRSQKQSQNRMNIMNKDSATDNDKDLKCDLNTSCTFLESSHSKTNAREIGK